MNEQERHDLFAKLIARHQSELYSYIFAVVRNWNDADDLLQSVSLILWRKFETFEPGSNFLFWASRTAKIVVSNHLRTNKRDGDRYVSDELLNALVDTVVDVPGGEMEQYLDALRRCREKLSPVDEELLDLHYAEDVGSRQIAERLQRSQSSVCHSLNRIRSWLFKCVQAELAQQRHLLERLL